MVYSATIPAGTLTADGLKYSFKDDTGANDGISQLQLKLDDDPTKSGKIKLKTIKMNFPLATATGSPQYRVTLTLHDVSASTQRVLLDQRVWSGSGSVVKAEKEASTPIYH